MLKLYEYDFWDLDSNVTVLIIFFYLTCLIKIGYEKMVLIE